LTTKSGTRFRAAVPSGVSTGRFEAVELRDNDANAYHGKGVSRTIANVNDRIAPAMIAQNFDVTKQEEIDTFLKQLDGTENKSNLGANAILGVSLAVCRAAAAHRNIPLYKHVATLADNEHCVLPVPCFNVINGGAHAGNALAIQEFMIVPLGALTFFDAMRMGTEVYAELKLVIESRFGKQAAGVGDEGGFAPNLSNTRECLQLICDAINRAGYEDRVKIGIDAAANTFYCEDNDKYNLEFKTEQCDDESSKISGCELAHFYKELLREFPIVFFEDPFAEDDWPVWQAFVKDENTLQILGDDLTVSNVARIAMALEKKACNALLLKLNQIGTVSEAIAAAKLARKNGWNVMVSHRSGETEDTFIADFVVGLGCGQIKSGAPCRSERLAKYNQLLRIEEDLGASAQFAGKHAFDVASTMTRLKNLIGIGGDHKH